MSVRHVDVAILGAGTAGLTARRAAKAEGASVLLIDPGPFGTTCARVGCMPSKLLIAAAHAAHAVEGASRFGVHTEGATVDGKAVLARVQAERDRFVGFVVDGVEAAKEAGELIVGRGVVTAPGVLTVGETEVHYRSLVVATGTAPFVPPPFRDLGDRLLTNEHIFELEDLPESLLVIGLGVIGLELGQAMHRLGVRTTLLGVGGSVGPLSDPVVRDSAAAVLGAELDLHPDYTLEAIERTEEGVRIRFVDSAGVSRDEVYERVLIAAGRRSTLPRLGLDALGLDGDYPVDPETLQLADLPVFVAGDVNGLHPLLHEAADDGRSAGRNAARFPEVEAAKRRTPLGIVFSDPQIGVIGRNWASRSDVAVGQVDYGDQGRARVEGINAGIARIYGDPETGELLGAELFGPRVEHLSHLLAWAVQQRLTVWDALDMPFYHPVVEEGIRTALRDLARSVETAGKVAA
jgi:dihydrolipoamide dehydrogenase